MDWRIPNWIKQIWNWIRLTGDIYLVWDLVVSAKTKVAAMMAAFVAWIKTGGWIYPVIIGVGLWVLLSVLERLFAKRVKKPDGQKTQISQVPENAEKEVPQIESHEQSQLPIYFRDSPYQGSGYSENLEDDFLSWLHIEVFITEKGRVIPRCRAELVFLLNGDREEDLVELQWQSKKRGGEHAIDLEYNRVHRVILFSRYTGENENIFSDHGNGQTTYLRAHNCYQNGIEPRQYDAGQQFFKIRIISREGKWESPEYMVNFPRYTEDNGHLWIRFRNAIEDNHARLLS